MIEIFKKNSKKLVFGTIISSLILAVIVYLIIGPYNYDFIELLLKIRERGIALYVCVILFPAFLIFFFTINLAEAVIKKK